jgi:hypothetical protein
MGLQGSQGAIGPAGPTGATGPAGSGQWNCPDVTFTTCQGLSCIFGVPGASFDSPDNLGTVFYNGDTAGPSQKQIPGTLPAQGYSEHWYRVKYETGSVGSQTLYGPAFVLYDGSTFNVSFDYVVDAFDQYGQPMQQCNVLPPFTTAPATGVTAWSGNIGGFSYDPFNYSVHCAPAETPVYLRVRPLSMNYQCKPYTLVVFNG